MNHLAADLKRSPMTTRPELLDAEGHVCAFFHSYEEEYRVLLPFIKEGFEHSERACHIVEPARRGEHLQQLAAAGIDVAGAEARGQLVVLDWSQTYLAGGSFDQKRVMAQFASARDEGRRQGYSRSRFVCHMEWAVEQGKLDELAEYEATSNFAPLNGDVAICSYQLNRWGGSLLINALRTHPLVILGGLLHENPYYQPPAEVLVELKARRASACC